MELVIGDRKNTVASQLLVDELNKIELYGTLYLGYPILADMDSKVIIDALLTTRECGVVLFDFNGGIDIYDLEAINERQNDLYAAIYSKFWNYKPLRNRKNLNIDINVITLIPDEKDEHVGDETNIISYKNLIPFLSELDDISSNDLIHINAAVQRISTIKPNRKRVSAQTEGSKGSIMKKIEVEIANLDSWQKNAAIETPEGPQRIRGLAGSGKTIVLALKASYLHARNPELKICVTFQTRSLYQQLKDLIRRFTFDQIQDEPDWDNLLLLHAWGSPSQPGVYSEFANSIGITPKDFTYAKNEYGYDEAFGGICKELLESIHDMKIDPIPIFDILLIDEAQDFPQDFFKIAYMATHEPKIIIWAYDELQNLGVYSMAPPSDLFGKNNDGSPRITELVNEPNSPKQDIVLPVCYRNSPWALTIAHALGFGIYREEGLVQFFDEPNLWKDIGYEVTNGRMHQGDYVELRRKTEASPRYFNELLDHLESTEVHVFDNLEEQSEWLASSIKENLENDELEMRDILIILANPKTARKRSGNIIQSLDNYDIPAHLAGVDTSRDILFSDDSVAISGIYRAKGNEAAMVYLLDSEYCYSGLELIKRRNILFTAVTRSKAWVRIAGCGAEMEYLKHEITEVREKGYKLCFNVPTDHELTQIRKIHKDMSPELIKAKEKLDHDLGKYIEYIERGDISIENIDPIIRKKLKDLMK